MEAKVISKFHPTRLNYIKRYFFAIIFILLSTTLYFDMFNLVKKLPIPNIYFLLLLFPAFLLFLTAEISRMKTTYEITDQQLIVKYGIFSKVEDTIGWDKIAITTLKQSLLQRPVKVGTVELWSMSGAEEPEIILYNIPKAKEIKSIIDGLIKEREIISARLITKPSKEVKPKVDIAEALSLASKYLDKNNIHIFSLFGAKFSTEKGAWEFLFSTDEGNYSVEVSNEKKVVGMSKLSQEEVQQKMKEKFSAEK
jgi:uncharacterized membrane protein YdbT with pleckstrin-like domain